MGVLRQRAHRILTAGGVCTETSAASVLSVGCSVTPSRLISHNRNGGTTNMGQDVMWRS